jgi:hypothetical protein
MFHLIVILKTSVLKNAYFVLVNMNSQEQWYNVGAKVFNDAVRICYAFFMIASYLSTR